MKTKNICITSYASTIISIDGCLEFHVNDEHKCNGKNTSFILSKDYAREHAISNLLPLALIRLSKCKTEDEAKQLITEHTLNDKIDDLMALDPDCKMLSIHGNNIYNKIPNKSLLKIDENKNLEMNVMFSLGLCEGSNKSRRNLFPVLLRLIDEEIIYISNFKEKSMNDFLSK